MSFPSTLFMLLTVVATFWYSSSSPPTAPTASTKDRITGSIMIFLRSISRGPRETSTLRDPYFRRDNAPPSYASRPTDRCARRSSASERQPCASTHPKHESGLLLPSDFARCQIG